MTDDYENVEPENPEPERQSSTPINSSPKKDPKTADVRSEAGKNGNVNPLAPPIITDAGS